MMVTNFHCDHDDENDPADDKAQGERNMAVGDPHIGMRAVQSCDDYRSEN